MNQFTGIIEWIKQGQFWLKFIYFRLVFHSIKSTYHTATDSNFSDQLENYKFIFFRLEASPKMCFCLWKSCGVFLGNQEMIIWFSDNIKGLE